MPTTLVQLSDLHVRAPGELACGRVDSNAFLRQAVAAVRAMEPPADAVVITGDLVDLARADEYRHLRELLRPLRCPVFLLPGNHDDGAALRAAFPDHAYLGTSGDLCYSVAVGELQLLALDTTVPRQAHGALGPGRLDWLARALDAAEGRPVLLAMHHPPFRTGIAAMDAIGLLAGAETLDALLRRHRNVARVICGHVHRAIEAEFGGALASICPSPAHQVQLDLRDDASEAFWNLEPGALRVHRWATGPGWVSHLLHVGTFPGPFPFED